MIQIKEKLFSLHTNKTTYCFHILPSGHPEHLYYGKRIEIGEAEALALQEKKVFAPGTSVVYSEEYPNLCLEDIPLEFSSYGKGDLREPLLQLQYEDGNTTCDYLFSEARIIDHFPSENLNTDGMNLPYSYGEKKEEILEVIYNHKEYDTLLKMYYRVFEECDVIAKCVVLENCSTKPVSIQRIMSGQLDLEDNGWYMETFNGTWAREMKRNRNKVTSGMHVSESVSGVSSNRANPFVMLSREDTTEHHGICIGSNLLYSGNHCESLSVNAYGRSRFLTGINPKMFGWKLEPGQQFCAPESILTYSEEGYEGISGNLHFFVNEHIVRGCWKQKDRPVLLNSWEAAYFHFNERKLLKLARQGRKAGIELFVMDDGWFGKRNQDTSSLGDWVVNKKKLPHGIAGLGKKINKMGMQFGLWVEPEMVNEDSDCYRAHSDWALKAPRGEHSKGRHQMLLDLCNPEVVDYLIQSMRHVFSSGPVSYVKWDMNRNFSDYYSPYLPENRQAETAHRYILGLYRLMDTLTREFPEILFEGCASGGNRFDLGILSYFPQIWASDNTDAISRLEIQEGLSYGYPQSCYTAHVSSCPNHQTLRVTPLDSRYHVAAFGVLGYECNLAEMPSKEQKEVALQIADYKQYRHTLQYGRFYRIQNGNITKWMTVSQNQDEAVGMMIQKMVIPDTTYEAYQTHGLSENRNYHFYSHRKQNDIRQFGDLVNAVSPIHIKKDSFLHRLLAVFVKMEGEQEDITVSGKLLNTTGIRLKQGFAATGYSNEVRLFQDYHSRMYYMEEDK